MRTKDDLRILQAQPLQIKILMTRRRVKEWVREYGAENVSVDEVNNGEEKQ